MLVGTPEFIASINVDGLAPIFHIDKADTVFDRVVPIPQRFWGIEGAQGALTTRDFFQVYDTLFSNTSQANPVGLYDNFFLHHHQIISLSKFAPTILFTSESETITVREPITVTSIATPVFTDSDGAAVTDVVRGSLYEVTTASVTVPVGEDVAVAYSIVGATSTKTYITRNGVLYVGGDEKATSLTVGAVSTLIDPTNPALDGKTSTATLTVSGDIHENWPVGGGALAGIIINGVTIDGFDVADLTYALTLPAASVVTKAKVEALTVGGPDVTTTISKEAPGYKVTLSVDSGVGAAKDYVVTVTVP